MGYPDKPQAGATVTRDGAPSLCVQAPVRLSLSRISPVASRITLLTHRHGCKDPLANWQSSFCTRRECCLKVCMKFSLWTYGDKRVMTVPPPKKNLSNYIKIRNSSIFLIFSNNRIYFLLKFFIVSLLSISFISILVFIISSLKLAFRFLVS